MSIRSDNQVLPHHDLGKQQRRLLLAGAYAKIKWVGRLTYEDRTKILNRLNIQP